MSSCSGRVKTRPVFQREGLDGLRPTSRRYADDDLGDVQWLKIASTSIDETFSPPGDHSFFRSSMTR
jgi:hypothetical protein